MRTSALPEGDTAVTLMGRYTLGTSLLWGGAVVYWIWPLTLDKRVRCLFPVNAWHFCPSTRHFIHRCSPSLVFKWVLGRIQISLVMWISNVAPARWRLASMLPRELKMCTVSVCGIVTQSNDWGNNNVVNQHLEHYLSRYVRNLSSHYYHEHP